MDPLLPRLPPRTTFANPVSPAYADRMDQNIAAQTEVGARTAVKNSLRVEIQHRLTVFWFLKASLYQSSFDLNLSQTSQDNEPPSEFEIACPTFPFFHPKNDKTLVRMVGLEDCETYGYHNGTAWKITGLAQELKVGITILWMRSPHPSQALIAITHRYGVLASQKCILRFHLGVKKLHGVLTTRSLAITWIVTKNVLVDWDAVRNQDAVPSSPVDKFIQKRLKATMTSSAWQEPLSDMSDLEEALPRPIEKKESKSDLENGDLDRNKLVEVTPQDGLQDLAKTDAPIPVLPVTENTLKLDAKQAGPVPPNTAPGTLDPATVGDDMRDPNTAVGALAPAVVGDVQDPNTATGAGAALDPNLVAVHPLDPAAVGDVRDPNTAVGALAPAVVGDVQDPNMATGAGAALGPDSVAVPAVGDVGTPNTAAGTLAPAMVGDVQDPNAATGTGTMLGPDSMAVPAVGDVGAPNTAAGALAFLVDVNSAGAGGPLTLDPSLAELAPKWPTEDSILSILVNDQRKGAHVYSPKTVVVPQSSKFSLHIDENWVVYMDAQKILEAWSMSPWFTPGRNMDPSYVYANFYVHGQQPPDELHYAVAYAYMDEHNKDDEGLSTYQMSMFDLSESRHPGCSSLRAFWDPETDGWALVLMVVDETGVLPDDLSHFITQRESKQSQQNQRSVKRSRSPSKAPTPPPPDMTLPPPPKKSRKKLTATEKEENRLKTKQEYDSQFDACVDHLGAVFGQDIVVMTIRDTPQKFKTKALCVSVIHQWSQKIYSILDTCRTPQGFHIKAVHVQKYLGRSADWVKQAKDIGGMLHDYDQNKLPAAANLWIKTKFGDEGFKTHRDEFAQVIKKALLAEEWQKQLDAEMEQASGTRLFPPPSRRVAAENQPPAALPRLLGVPSPDSSAAASTTPSRAPYRKYCARVHRPPKSTARQSPPPAPAGPFAPAAREREERRAAGRAFETARANGTAMVRLNGKLARYRLVFGHQPATTAKKPTRTAAGSPSSTPDDCLNVEVQQRGMELRPCIRVAELHVRGSRVQLRHCVICRHKPSPRLQSRDLRRRPPTRNRARCPPQPAAAPKARRSRDATSAHSASTFHRDPALLGLEPAPYRPAPLVIRASRSPPYAPPPFPARPFAAAAALCTARFATPSWVPVPLNRCHRLHRALSRSLHHCPPPAGRPGCAEVHCRGVQMNPVPTAPPLSPHASSLRTSRRTALVRPPRRVDTSLCACPDAPQASRRSFVGAALERRHSPTAPPLHVSERPSDVERIASIPQHRLRPTAPPSFACRRRRARAACPDPDPGPRRCAWPRAYESMRVSARI
ncbi:hypothetical protein B0H15DRAFT_954493 [Mycena belliarum]|uniref:Uncharacterized protein n=1 Tax=Mycena belliarum TaxID=1033014 RepID=A0AAD6TUD7_9AGAR|nr:hypothetical protein B0H15DRAFT_954493 [Mycena belliae]